MTLATLHIDPVAELRRVRAERGRRSFRVFVSMVRPSYELEPFHERICEEIQAWADSPTVYHLLLSCPPGHGKSEYAKLAAAWLFTRDIHHHIAYASYTSDLAVTQLLDLQSILESEEYVAVYGPVLNARRVVTDGKRGAKKTSDYAEHLHGGGWLKAVGRGGSLTGFRVDSAVVDDLLKDDTEASSATVREAAWRWLTRVLLTRKRPGRPLRLLMIATRWHLDDPSARFVARYGQRVREVVFSALKVGPPTELDPREDGEALWPAVATREELEEARELDPEGFAALYQQHPVVEGGNIFKLGWFSERWVSLSALLHQPGEWVQSWDCRNDGKDERTSSRVSAGLWFFPERDPGRVYLVDVRAERWSPDETLLAFDDLQSDPLWSRASVRLIEAKADGKMLLSLRQRRYPGMTPISPSASKVLRARAVTPFTSAGNVILPDAARWLADYLGELTTFPSSPGDDHVDMTSQVLAWRWLVEPDRDAPPPNPLERLKRRMGR